MTPCSLFENTDVSEEHTCHNLNLYAIPSDFCFLWSFVTSLFFTVRTCYPHAQPPSCRNTPCRLSATAYSIYSQVPSYLEAVSSIRNLRTRHAVVTWDPPNFFRFVPHWLYGPRRTATSFTTDACSSCFFPPHLRFQLSSIILHIFEPSQSGLSHFSAIGGLTLWAAMFDLF
jgi:hypothetical protein